MVVLRTGPIATSNELIALIRRWSRHWNVDIPLSGRDLDQMFSSGGFHPELDTRAYWTGSELVAFGLVTTTPSGTDRQQVGIFGLVDPLHRHHGIGRSLLAWQVERAAELLVDRQPGSSREIRAIGNAGVDEHIRLYRRFGFHPRRARSHTEYPVYVLVLP